MRFVDAIVIHTRTACQGCGAFICKPDLGEFMCPGCERQFVKSIEDQATRELEAQAIAQDEGLRKSGALS